jgi:chloramphenicol-sensitive protein RarD
VPLIALFLASTFWTYGLIRKQIDAKAQSGLFVECLLLMGPGIAFAVWQWRVGGGLFGHSASGTLLIMLAGPVTVAPLALFSWTARRLPLSVIGFVQFISPTMTFALGSWLGEPLTPLRLVSFGFIWAGVVAFAVGSLREAKRAHPVNSGSDRA